MKKAAPAKTRKSKFPKEVIIPLEKAFVDARGAIQPLVDTAIRTVQIITSRKGTVRANHYHKTDWHYCYVVAGKIEYYHRPVGSKAKPEKIVVKAGQVFFTPSMVEHAMVFAEETTFLNMAGKQRDQKHYEKDLVRVELVKG
jgi:dTDP-4-dehydrorhamnose 3,5-epimerase-like enzyme